MKNKIVGYARVSTQEQDLKNQKYEILNYADKNDLTITSWVRAFSFQSTTPLHSSDYMSLGMVKNHWKIQLSQHREMAMDIPCY